MLKEFNLHLKQFERYLVITGAIGILLLLANTVLTYRNITTLDKRTGWVVHTEQVLYSLRSVMVLLDDAETGERGYVITGKESYLEPFNKSAPLIAAEIERVKSLTADNPHQQARVPELQALVDARLKSLRNTITLRRQSFEMAHDAMMKDDGKEKMDAARQLITSMEDEENILWQQRRAETERSRNVALVTGLFANAADIILLIAFAILAHKNMRDRLRAAEQLYERHEWYRTTLASIGDAVIATDDKGRVSYLNEEAETMTGWTMQAAMKRSLKEVFNIVNEHSRMVVENPVEKVIRDGKKVGLANHTVLIAKDGSERPIADTAAPIRSQDGTLVGVILVFHDVLNQRTLEKELHKKADMLLERDRRKDEFLAMLAHELRNPLAPVSNALHILRSKMLGEHTREEALDMASQQIKHMVRLLDDLLDVSRITHGKISLRNECIDLCDVIRQAVNTASANIREHKHTLQLKMADCPVWVMGDSTRLAQLFGNLLNNAAKYTKDGGHISVEVQEGHKRVVVYIKDNGIGIAPEQLPYIFDMFTQVDSSMERSYGGLGIGLMLVRRIAELHGGAVEAHSDGLGKGTEFVVILPMAEQQGKPAIQHEQQAQPTKRFRILIVDDNEASAKTLGWMMEALGHQIKLAYNATTALQVASEFRPEVILLDIGMPDMNGYELCLKMRKEKHLEDVVIIAQTGWGQEQHLKRAKDAGFDFHLTKPISFETLQKQLEGIRKTA